MTNTQNLTADALALACANAMWAEDKASAELGMKIQQVQEGRAVVQMTIRPEMVNGMGICHGGMLFTLADSAFAFACNSYNQRAVARQCSIVFLQAVPVGSEVTACAEERQRGTRSGIYDVRLTNEKNETVAEFRGMSRTIEGTHV